MRKHLAILAVLPLLGACSIVEGTNRSRIAWIPDSYMWNMGATSYEEATDSYPQIRSGPQYEMMMRVGERIAAASGHPEYDWEFRLLDAPGTVNAFCLPGGKVAVYSGILPITRDEDGLAVVIGHEVAHATAEHGNERMTHQILVSVGLVGSDLGLKEWFELDDPQRAEVMAVLGVGAQYGVVLPYSRDHESEADELGLRFLIRAGYDPYAAPALWERMAEASGPDRPPELLSTHPDPLNRAERLRQLIPQISDEEARRNIR